MATVHITVDPGTVVDIAYWDDPAATGVVVVAALGGVFDKVTSPPSSDRTVALAGVGADGLLGVVGADTD